MADNRVAAIRDIDLRCGLVGVEDHDDVAPVITACVVLQTVGDGACWGIKELQVLAYEIGIAQTEGRMVLAQGDEVLVVGEHLRILRLVAPVELVDGVWGFEAIVDAFLVTQQFFAREHEGYTLGGEDGRLCQEVKADQFVCGDTRDRGFQAIYEAQVIVAAHVAGKSPL